MKRFKLETGHIVKVDDCDAYLLRTRVYHCHTNKTTGVHVVRRTGDFRYGTAQYLSHHIAGGPGIKAVVHQNRDGLDFTRANLVPLTAEQYAEHEGRRIRAEKLAKKLTA